MARFTGSGGSGSVGPTGPQGQAGLGYNLVSVSFPSEISPEQSSISFSGVNSAYQVNDLVKVVAYSSGVTTGIGVIGMITSKQLNENQEELPGIYDYDIQIDEAYPGETGMGVEWRFSLVGAQGEVGPQGDAGPAGSANVINTDGNPGQTIYVGATDPSISYTLQDGDVWIETA